MAGLALATTLSAAFAGDFAADYAAPGSDSAQAQALLVDRFPSQSGDTVDVVVRAEAGVADPTVRATVVGLLGTLADQPHVAAVEDPYAAPGAISADGRTLLSHIRLDVTNPVDMPIADTERLIETAAEAEQPGLEVALGGQSIQLAEQGEIGSEGIGLAAAAIILLLTFGSVVAAGLPLVVAVTGLAVSGALIGLLAAVVDVPDWSTSLAAMMGIGIGIDYVLLMVTRFRGGAAGLDTESATVATLDTAGRSVLVAGSTVVVSMLGLFAMGLSFMRGAARDHRRSARRHGGRGHAVPRAARLFRAMDRPASTSPRAAPAVQIAAGGHVVPSRGWVRWSRLVDRHSVIAAVAGVAVLLALAPFLGVGSAFPTPATTPRADQPGRPTTWSAPASGRVRMDRSCWSPT